MNEETLIEYAGKPLDSLPEAFREQLAADAQLQKAFEDQVYVKTLLSFKRYEEPEPGMSQRVSRNLRLSLYKHKPPLGQRLAFHNSHTLPAWVRMAAVVVIMLGLSVLTHREMLRNEILDEAYDIASEAHQGMDLAATASLNSLQANELVHRDPFTTQLPERFLFPLPDLAMDVGELNTLPNPEPTIAPFLQNPMTLPVLYTSRNRQ